MNSNIGFFSFINTVRVRFKRDYLFACFWEFHEARTSNSFVIGKPLQKNHRASPTTMPLLALVPRPADRPGSNSYLLLTEMQEQAPCRALLHHQLEESNKCLHLILQSAVTENHLHGF